jgi:hypothetical protein
MSPFRASGDHARWKIIYGLLTATETGDILTYEAMAKALGLDPDEDRHKLQMAVRRAAKEHLVNDLRSLEPVTNEGYRVVETPKKLELAGQHQAKAKRSIARGRAHVIHVDISGMDETTRQAFELMAWKFAQQDEMIRRLDVRQQRTQRQVEAARADLDLSTDQISKLMERMDALEAKMRKTDDNQTE